MNKNQKTVFRIAVINSVIMIWGLILGFKLESESNMGYGIVLLFVFLSVITVGFQLKKIGPYLDNNIRTNWTLIVMSPLICIAILVIFFGGLFAMVSAFMAYIQKYGV